MSILEGEVEKALRDYLELTRKNITPLPDHENALFLSTQRKRIGGTGSGKYGQKICKASDTK